jgi:hypothetical protein
MLKPAATVPMINLLVSKLVMNVPKVFFQNKTT